MTARIVATDAALDAVERLTAAHGPLMLFLSGGCCDGSSPLCLPEGELPTGPNDVLLGAVGGAPVYISSEQDERWNHPTFVLDVAPGAADGFSIEAGPGLHFLLRPPSSTAGGVPPARAACGPSDGGENHAETDAPRRRRAGDGRAVARSGRDRDGAAAEIQHGQGNRLPVWDMLTGKTTKAAGSPRR